jgi:hypothetical protein
LLVAIVSTGAKSITIDDNRIKKIMDLIALFAVIILTKLPHGYKISYLKQDWTLLYTMSQIFRQN